jgi:predicted dehydrogenase
MNDHSTPLKKVSRRNFIKTSAFSAATFMIVPRHVLGGRGFIAPSDKVNIGIVGAGGKGKENTADFLKLNDVQVVAIADPAIYWNLENFYYKTEAGRGPVKKMIEDHYKSQKPAVKVAEYEDFRLMLDKQPALDAIVCSTPDHTHAYISLLAMRAGKHVYCEKPLTHNIWEARQVQQLARETKLATQMGNMGHSTEGIRRTVEYLRSGAIGQVHQVHAWVPATRWNPELKGVPTTNLPIPKGLNWELWLGPRASRPFHSAYAPVSWRDFWTFGCGALGDFGCHDLDAATWALDLQAPESVEILPAGYFNKDIIPYGEIGYYKFAARGVQPPLKLTWYSGGLRPEAPGVVPESVKLPRRGTMFVGEKGILVNDGGERMPQLYPESLRESFSPPQASLARSNGHFRDWIDAIKGGSVASANFEYGARLTEITLLGVLSLRLGGMKLYWDAQNMKVKGHADADEYIQEPVRKGWEMV